MGSCQQTELHLTMHKSQLVVLAVFLLPFISSLSTRRYPGWLGGSLLPVKVDTVLVPGSEYDGLDSVLEVYGIEEEAVKAIRDARIVTVIDISEDEEISIATSEADSQDEANTVGFTPGTPTNITNPLNGEA